MTRDEATMYRWHGRMVRLGAVSRRRAPKPGWRQILRARLPLTCNE